MTTTFTIDDARQLLKKRDPEAHKGNFGHALMVVGSKGMAGAAILSTRACMRSGAGLVTVNTPDVNRVILQSAVPEAMCTDSVHSFNRYNAIGCGCGLGRDDAAKTALTDVLQSGKQLLLDADALNIIAAAQLIIPQGTVITPHDMEFDRLSNRIHNSRIERIITATEMAARDGIIVVLKGAGTVVVAPDGEMSVNSTGNAGMATGGSGDVLSGIITALLAQGYAAYDAARLGVFLHGMAGDMAADELSQESMIAGDIINYLPKAFKSIS